jgi:crotonobetainyl-CoA:carnitine CoA-transferase CaiB-like acyl-CoA transferase
MQMAQLGAEVIKIEPLAGDVIRGIDDVHSRGLGPIFIAVNRGKRSVALDLRVPAGRDALLRIAATADVFMHNMRPAAIAKLGLGYPVIRDINPRCVYASLVGFGSAGPYRDRAAYDDVIQAISGFADLQGAGTPAYARSALADKTVGLQALAAILAALFRRSVTAAGQSVEVPMFETMAAFNLLDQQGGYVFDPPRGTSGYARTASPFRRPYRTEDGFISVVIYTDKQWQAFFDLIGRSELGAEPRFRSIRERTTYIDELYSLVESELPARSTEDWLKTFAERGIPGVPVLSLEELFDDEHLNAVGFFQPARDPQEGTLRLTRHPATFSDDEPAPAAAAPVLGADSTAVLLEAGLSEADVAALRAEGVIR